MKPISVLLETKDVMQLVKLQGTESPRGGGGGGRGVPPLASNAGSCCHLAVGRLAPRSTGWDRPAVSPWAP